MSPDTLQTLGVLAIGLGFVLIGLGGISTYHASVKLQHQAELREAEQKGEMNAQIITLLLKNQQLQQKAEQAPPGAPAGPAAATPEQPAPEPQPQHEATPPAASYYYRPPSPPIPRTYTEAIPPIAEPPPETPSPAEPAPVPETSLDPLAPHQTPEWEEPESLAPEKPGRYLSIHQRHVIADTLRAHGRHMVTIESSYGDTVSHDFAVELGEAFADADWLVRGIDQHRGLPLASGVTVSAGSFPPAQETRAVYEALLSAGIAVTQQLDPKQHNGETLILVGTPL